MRGGVTLGESRQGADGAGWLAGPRPLPWLPSGSPVVQSGVTGWPRVARGMHGHTGLSLGPLCQGGALR